MADAIDDGMSSRPVGSKKLVLAAFRLGDPMSTGTIRTAHMLKLMTTLGIEYSEVIVDRFMETVERRGDDRIDYKQFLDFLWGQDPRRKVVESETSLAPAISATPAVQPVANAPPPPIFAPVAATACEAEAPTDEPPGKLDAASIGKLHSAARWGKPMDEFQAIVDSVGATVAEAVWERDPRNGNQLMHIAAQNGHMHLVQLMLAAGPPINGQNNGGQTPLHMSVEYDFYTVSKTLLQARADPTVRNCEEHAALTGISGSKTGVEAWDNPVTILKGVADDSGEIDVAFVALENADPSIIDKVALARVGMAKKKACQQHWNKDRFLQIMQRF